MRQAASLEKARCHAGKSSMTHASEDPLEGLASIGTSEKAQEAPEQFVYSLYLPKINTCNVGDLRGGFSRKSRHSLRNFHHPKMPCSRLYTSSGCDMEQ